jgi:hypothetical protein
MTMTFASSEVLCPFPVVMERVAHYLEDHGGTIALVLPMHAIGFPSYLQLRGDAAMRFVVTRDATDRTRRHDAIAISLQPFDVGVFPVFTGLIIARPLNDHAILKIDGQYYPPFRWLGALFDAIVGRRMASATAQTFIDDIRRYVQPYPKRSHLQLVSARNHAS